MRIVIITGMSGAGKTTALKIFEDAGYYVADNLPAPLLGEFTRFCLKQTGENMKKVALGVDIRGGQMFSDFSEGLKELDVMGVDWFILFLDSSDQVLTKRYKETRHVHPLEKNDLLSVAIVKERSLLEKVRGLATSIMDTSGLLPRQLKIKLLDMFGEHEPGKLLVNIVSFGFKYGLPEEADLVFDVRFLPNPFYNEKLKPLSGLDADVRVYVMSHEISKRFTDSLLAMLTFLLPHYISEGKSQLIVAIGCTGGRHRSVALSQELHKYLTANDNSVSIFHRDLDKDRTKK